MTGNTFLVKKCDQHIENLAKQVEFFSFTHTHVHKAHNEIAEYHENDQVYRNPINNSMLSGSYVCIHSEESDAQDKPLALLAVYPQKLPTGMETIVFENILSKGKGKKKTSSICNDYETAKDLFVKNAFLVSHLNYEIKEQTKVKDAVSVLKDHMMIAEEVRDKLLCRVCAEYFPLTTTKDYKRMCDEVQPSLTDLQYDIIYDLLIAIDSSNEVPITASLIVDTYEIGDNGVLTVRLYNGGDMFWKILKDLDPIDGKQRQAEIRNIYREITQIHTPNKSLHDILSAF